MHRRYVDCWHCTHKNSAMLCPPRSTLATVVVKNCQGYKKYKNRHADLKF